MNTPWNYPDESIPPLIAEWQEIRVMLELSFANRDLHTVTDPMQTGIDLFLKMLFWTNQKPLNTLDRLCTESLKYKPVNIEERLSFITKRPNLYHSFIQLSELMVEQEKQFVKRSVLKKASKPKMG
jgi:hypothetical protein